MAVNKSIPALGTGFSNTGLNGVAAPSSVTDSRLDDEKHAQSHNINGEAQNDLKTHQMDKYSGVIF